jgi:hypothetical protein
MMTSQGSADAVEKPLSGERAGFDVDVDVNDLV